MPNHFTTKVVFTKPMSKELKRFLTGLKKLEGGLCAALAPMPEIMCNTAQGFRSFDGPDGKKVEVREWYSNRDTKEERLFTPEEMAELRALGANSWYDWAAKNWGTKWGTYDSNVEGDRIWWCTSAWGPPLESIFQQMADGFGVNFATYGRDEFENELKLMDRYTAVGVKPPKARKKAVCPKAPSKKKK